MEPTSPPDPLGFTNGIIFPPASPAGASVGFPFADPQEEVEDDAHQPRDRQAVAVHAKETEKFQPNDENVPKLLPTWMSFEEKALAQGVQLLNIQSAPTPSLAPAAAAPAAATPHFSFPLLDQDDRPRPKPLPLKKSPDRRSKSTSASKSEIGESASGKKTLYERKWENYNALLAATKKEQGEEYKPAGKPAAVPFSLAAPALAPRLDVPNEKETEVVLTGNDPFVSLAFTESPTLDHLPKNIRTLMLTGVKMPIMPPELFNLTTLTILNYSMNEMKDLPSNIGKLSNLIHLDLSDNKLTSLPPNIGAMVQLQRLHLHQNCFIALPSAIGRLRSLCQLYLHTNALDTLPREIGLLTNLKELFLHENHLKELPASLGQLRKLSWLNISNNDMTRLPQSLGRLQGVLKTLICESVPLSDSRYTNLAWLAEQPPEVSVGASTFCADLATLVNRNDFSDVQVQCEKGPPILAHRPILGARVHRVQLPQPAGAEPIAKQLSMPVISLLMSHADTLAMMQFIYSGNVFVVQHLHDLIGTSNNEAYLPEDMLALLNSGKFSDLTLRAEGSEFRVHKAILSCRCTYWANLFASGMKESREEVLEVADLSATGLRLILTYLYTDNCVLDGETAVEILQAADRYQLHRLTEKVEAFLVESLDVDNILDLWEISDNYHAEQLNRRCLHQLASGAFWAQVRGTEAYQRLETNAALKQKLMKALSMTSTK